MADRNSIIDKIKALLAKTTANGATEAEMMSALDKASAMMDAYDITDAELQVAKDEAAMLHADPPDLKDPHKLKWQLCHGVSEFCGVQIYRSRRETGLKCIGMPSDVQLRCGCSTALLTSCSQNSMRISSAASHQRVSAVSSSDRSRRLAVIASYDRLLALVERSKVARTSNGRELVVIKDAAIKAFMKEHGIHLRMCVADPRHRILTQQHTPQDAPQVSGRLSVGP